MFSLPPATLPVLTGEVSATSSTHTKNLTAVRCDPHEPGVIATGSVDESVALTRHDASGWDVVDKCWLLRGAVVDVDFHPVVKRIVAAACMDGSWHLVDFREEGKPSVIQVFPFCHIYFLMPPSFVFSIFNRLPNASARTSPFNFFLYISHPTTLFLAW